ncbi:sensor histidine kinase [Herbiconiux daphne]|uniref:histidine kinase n=1 Tax=Herbiconiux daphne TaxID=2970914 RepID=A0ABT2H4W6_9MICO|nr:ATP-binding protein [Herbiconiux daphne]MCS5734980.1 ATP-binding protein [Herbiconiux daphne]
MLYNDRAAELLGITAPATTEPVSLEQLGVPAATAAVLFRDEVTVDEIVITPTHVIVVDRDRIVSQRPEGRRGGSHFVGTVTTLRDHTRLQELTGELATLTTLSDALRSQAHEFANRLHTMIALIELGRAAEAAELATSELTLSQQLADRMLTAVDEPVLLALLLGKSAQAAERGAVLDVSLPSRLPGDAIPTRELITIVGNLLDNALDAATAASPDTARVTVEVDLEAPSEPATAEADGRRARGVLRITVGDSGPGPSAEATRSLFEFGVTTKAEGHHGIGLALVRQAVARLGGTIEVERSRFTVRVPVAATGSAAAGVAAAGTAAAGVAAASTATAGVMP